LTAEKRHFLPADPDSPGPGSGRSDDFSRSCVQMLRMFPNATGDAADERQAEAAQVL
jgi:hypothetical protein